MSIAKPVEARGLRFAVGAILAVAGVPFTITVRVTAAALARAVIVATRINASYTNRSRSNLTPCAAFLGHDAATYHGHIALPTPPSGGAGT